MTILCIQYRSSRDLRWTDAMDLVVVEHNYQAGVQQPLESYQDGLAMCIASCGCEGMH